VINYTNVSTQMAVALDGARRISPSHHVHSCGAVLDGVAASLTASIGPERAAEFLYRWADESATLYPRNVVPQRKGRWRRGADDIATAWRLVGVPVALFVGFWLGATL